MDILPMCYCNYHLSAKQKQSTGGKTKTEKSPGFLSQNFSYFSSAKLKLHSSTSKETLQHPNAAVY